MYEVWVYPAGDKDKCWGVFDRDRLETAVREARTACAMHPGQLVEVVNTAINGVVWAGRLREERNTTPY